MIEGELYRRLPRGILSRCINEKEGRLRLEELYSQACGVAEKISLYRRMQRMGYYWPNMNKKEATIQEKCQKCQLSIDKEESYAVFVTEDWRTPLMEYLAQGILSTDRTLAHRLKKLVVRHFLQIGILFKKGYNEDPLRYLGPKEVREVVREVHSDDCGSHLEKRRLHKQLLLLGYYWPTMKRDSEELVKTCHVCQILGDAIHTHPNILAATEYFTKWVEAIPLKKATGATVTNFIREDIITRFGIHRRLINDNGTPFINKDMKSLAEAYCIKHGRSTPFYPQGNGLAEATNKVILKILKKIKHEYGGKWSDHLTDVLWACRNFVKTATGFSPFSLVCGIEAISPVELVIPTPRVVLKENQGDTEDTSNEKRLADLEGVEEERELARRRSQRYQQRMTRAYVQAVRPRAFTEGQLVLRTTEHVRRNLPRPSKFSPKWEGPYIIREAHDSEYYYLTKEDGTILTEPINGKWLKQYYA
ncbi:uncharacterized protein LOC142625117 [Castanea sativa]|uniref:uncharacterized protein LOC142625117 n=1 Tax=Castanea sativa TaxID=21020 RepID=UPI003F651F8E